MSKTKTLFTVALLVLLGSLGAVQAQSLLYEVNLYTTPAAGARAGGEDEMSGGVWVGFSPAPTAFHHGHSRLLRPSRRRHNIGSGYSHCRGRMASRTSVDTMVEGDGGERRITMTMGPSRLPELPSSPTNLVIRGVMLDVSDASGTVTVTAKVVSSEATDFIRIDGPSSATVIEDILVGVKATPEKSIRKSSEPEAQGWTEPRPV